jgi:pyruvate/2-oxoglutarate/acetoin dehydrogenase E1 component/TPP-dependent pyruvate/acetoin dehydrogenase alpha subunit
MTVYETRAEPRIFSESEFGVQKAEDAVYRRLDPDGTLSGKEPSITPDVLRKMYELMVLGRRFDVKATNMSTLREVGTYPPSRGQEATQVGFVLALQRGDWLLPMYRDIAGMIAFGYPPAKLLQYWGGDERGMKIPDGMNMFPIAVPVSTQVPHAVGLAMAKQIQNQNAVVAVSTGEGGTSKGDFHEGVNFAGVFKLPVVFAVENNQWAISLPRRRQTAAKTIAQKAVAYGLEGILVDGNDVIASYEVAKYAVEKARRGTGPTLIEFWTYRMGPHTTAELVSNKLKSPEELAEWEKRDSIIRLEKYLLKRGLIDAAYIESVVESVDKSIGNAIKEYRAIPPPQPAEIFMFMYDALTPPLVREIRENFEGVQAAEPETKKEFSVVGGKSGVNIRRALNMALRQEMMRDERIVVFEEDVGENGGVFQVTRGLQEEFGQLRVFDTPLAEAGIAGIFVGLAAGGLVPVAEFQFDGFVPPAYDQIFGHIARMRNRTRGRYTTQGVIRFPYGAGIRAPEHHSDSPEAYFCHTPGLKVVVPSNPYDAKGLLAAALREPNPVVFMEPKRLYDSPRTEVPEEDYTIPIGNAKIVKEGEDLTLVSFGAMMIPTLAAAETLAAEHSCSPEVIDLRTLSPLDVRTILQSVQKTGRLVIVHEAPRSFGLGAEIAAFIADSGLDYLKAPIKRVTGFDIVVPLARLEDVYLPSKERIVKAALETTKY